MVNKALSSKYFRDIPLQVIRQSQRMDTEVHSHEFMEMVIVVSGRAVHHLSGESRIVSSGDVFVITPHQWHNYTECKGFWYYDILFEPRALGLQRADIASLRGYHALFSIEPYLRERSCLPAGLKLDSGQLERTKVLLDKIISEMSGTERGKYFSATALFMQVVVDLCRCYGSANNSSGMVQGTDEAESLLALADVLSYIEMNLRRRITISELAGRALLSRSSFIRGFESVVGKPPLEYINSRRLQLACHGLRHTSTSVGQIAYECGFSDSNYFSRYFKSRMGVSPRDYRNQRNGY